MNTSVQVITIKVQYLHTEAIYYQNIHIFQPDLAIIKRLSSKQTILHCWLLF